MENRHDTKSLKFFLNNLDIENNNPKMKYFVNEIYQRKYVWNRKDMKQELIVSIFKGNPIGTIIIWNNEKNKRDEIVDGQQRIYTIYDFAKGDLSLNKKYKDKLLEDKKFREKLNEIINEKNEYTFDEQKKNRQEEINKAKRILDKNKLNLSFSDLPSKIRDEFFYDYILGITLIWGKKEEIAEYFIVLQNQEKLKAGEILNALNGQKLYDLFPKDEFIKKFSKIFNFKNKRQDLLKFLAFIILINQNKISLGASDKDLLEKITDFEFESLNEDRGFFDKVVKLNQELINIKENEKIFKNQTSKNALKIFLISYFYSNSELYNKLDLTKKIAISRKIAELTKKFKSQSEDEKNNLKEDYWKNIKEIEKILVRSHNKKKIKDVTNFNFDKLLEDQEFKDIYVNRYI